MQGKFVSYPPGSVRIVTAVLLTILVSACASRSPVKDSTKPMTSPAQVRAEAEQAVRYGDHARALSIWQQLLETSPDDVVALRGIGEVYLSVRENAAAVAAFDRVLVTLPDDPDSQEGRGLALLALGRRDEALRQLQPLDGATPPRWRSLNALGLLADLNNQRAQALGYYTRALALQPDSTMIVNNMGYSRLMAGDYAMAEQHFQAGLASAPDDRHLRGNLVMAIAWQGDYARALAEAETQQSREEALNNIGYIALLRKDYPAAIHYFEAAIAASPRWYPRASANLERARQEASAVMAASKN